MQKYLNMLLYFTERSVIGNYEAIAGSDLVKHDFLKWCLWGGKQSSLLSVLFQLFIVYNRLFDSGSPRGRCISDKTDKDSKWSDEVWK